MTTIKLERFVIQASTLQQGWWVCTDKLHNILCSFEEHKFNETHQFSLGSDTFKTEAEALAYATYLREMGDWLRENHYDKIF